MITRVELVNFKSHASPGNVFEFTGGANAVLGPTGAGKTSVLQAIGLCVFDFGQPRHYLRKGTKKGEAIVTFRSPIDHKHYTVKRQLGGSRFHLLDEHGATLAETKDEALRTVRAKLGLDANADLEGLFAELIGTPQGQLTGAFLQKKEHRVEIFNHILKIEQYRNAYEALRPVESHGRTKIGQVKEQIIAVETRLEGAAPRAADLQATTDATVKARDTSTKAVEAQGVAVQALQSVGAEKQKADEGRDALQLLSHKLVAHQQSAKDLERRLAESTQAQAWLDENDADLKLGQAAEKYVEEHEATFKQHQSDLRTVTDTNLQHQKIRQDIGKWETRRIEKAKELETAPDFAALTSQLAGLEGAEKEADAASQKTVGALEQAKARVTDLPRIKKNWSELEKIRVAAASVPIAFQNGNHRARLDEGKLRVHQLTTLQQSLDGQFEALASKTCPLLDVSCPIPIANVSQARDEKKRHLIVDVREAEGALVSLQRAATLEETYARQLQTWEPRQTEHQEAAALIAELQKIHDGLPGVQQEATAKKQILVETQTARRACETKINQRAHYDNLRSQVQELDRDMNAGRADLKKLEDLVANVQANVRALAPIAEAYE
ncbi:MAG TPA: AAA family ATPase, partial [Candidatus Thermoplasmatota archaeon]